MLDGGNESDQTSDNESDQTSDLEVPILLLG